MLQMVNIKIHRGTSQIGGTITEIYTENTHIFIDFGSDLTVNPEESTDNKMIEMIKNAECDAVLFSHYHGDHVGLLEHIPKKDIRGNDIIPSNVLFRNMLQQSYMVAMIMTKQHCITFRIFYHFNHFVVCGFLWIHCKI